ncbi:hypothetical protein AB0E67_27200 [Streptomyces sp. NPDC032161]|uniref:hypothetical protein n=1 Tax=unclassified Streptomyces TaxID=2593676 RepID=UPI0033FBF871
MANNALQAAADAVRAHQQDPDSYTFHDMNIKVSTAQAQGHTLKDIADANQTS